MSDIDQWSQLQFRSELKKVPIKRTYLRIRIPEILGLLSLLSFWPLRALILSSNGDQAGKGMAIEFMATLVVLAALIFNIIGTISLAVFTNRCVLQDKVLVLFGWLFFVILIVIF
jgi:hypothetical protein